MNCGKLPVNCSIFNLFFMLLYDSSTCHLFPYISFKSSLQNSFLSKFDIKYSVVFSFISIFVILNSIPTFSFISS